MPGITTRGVRYPDGATKANNLGPELKTMAEDLDRYIAAHATQGETGKTGPIGPASPLAVANVAATADYVGSSTPNAVQDALARTTGRRKTSAFFSSSGKANNASLVNDSGQALRNFGSAPAFVSGGRLVHTPHAGASAAYLETNQGEQVGHIGATVVFPAANSGVIALIVATSSWADRSLSGASGLPWAGCHLVIGRGSWEYAVWDEAQSRTIVLRSGNYKSPLVVGNGYDVDVNFDLSKDLAVVALPDGTSVDIIDSRIRTSAGDFAVHELFESDGANMVSAHLLNLRSDRRDGRNATAREVALGASSRALPIYARAEGHAFDWGPPNVLGQNTDNIGNGYLALAVTFPPSRKLLLTATFVVDMPTAANLVVVPTMDGQEDGTPFSVAQGPYRGSVTYRGVIENIPGYRGVIQWRAFLASGSGVTIRNGNGNGYATMSAQAISVE